MAPKAQKTRSSIVDNFVHRHPLQRLPSPSRSISAAIHALGIASFSYSFDYLTRHPNHINQAYGWHFQYLTIIGLTLAMLTFVVGLAADLTLSRQLFLLKNIFSITAAPMETLITFLYWGLRSIDPELVVPKELALPLPSDMSFHLTPTLLLLIDLLFLSPPWAISALPAFGLSLAIAFIYWFWIEICYTQNGFYPYPLFELLNTPQRVGLFVGSAAVMGLSTLVLKLLYSKVNGVEVESVPGKVKKAQ